MKTAWLRVPAIAIAALLAAACAAAAPTSAPSTTGPTATGTPAATATPATSASPLATATAGASPTGSAPAESPAESASPTPQPTTFFAGPTTVGEGVTAVRWYCCLGAGNDPSQVEVEAKVINDFNAAHTDIQIQGEFVNYLLAYDTLATEIAGGSPPDIVGPVGFGGANAFSGHWLDLSPLIESTGFDTSQYE